MIINQYLESTTEVMVMFRRGNEMSLNIPVVTSRIPDAEKTILGSLSHFLNLKFQRYMSAHSWLTVWFPLMPEHIKTRSFNLRLEAQPPSFLRPPPPFPLFLGKDGRFIPDFLLGHFKRIIAPRCHLHKALKIANIQSHLQKVTLRSMAVFDLCPRQEDLQKMADGTTSCVPVWTKEPQTESTRFYSNFYNTQK